MTSHIRFGLILETFKEHRKILAWCLLGLVSSAAFGTTSTDTDFGSIVTLLKNWTEGTLGTVMELAGFLVGIAVGINSQSVMAGAKLIGGVAVVRFMPTVIENVFGACI